jgi:hypothetical protein
VALFAMAIGACDRKAPSRADKTAPKLAPAEAPTEAAAAGAPATQPVANTPKVQKKTADEPTKAAGAPAVAAPVVKAAAEPAPAATPPSAGVAAAAPQSQVDPGACEKACANVLAISLAEMKTTPPKVRTAIEKRVKSDCPKQCQQHGTLASVDCLSKAKTASELAACPR